MRFSAPLLCLLLLCSAAPARAELWLPDWLERFELGAFAEATFAWNYQRPLGEPGLSTVLLPQNGFGFSWAGLDVHYPAAPVGATVNLRLGPLATAHGGHDSDVSLHWLKQAFVSYSPLDGLQLDLGKFDTPFGLEAAESQYNFCVTRGLVYMFVQPTFHAGLRASYAFWERFSATLILANGWDNTVDLNAGKSAGVQLGYALGERLSLAVGYLVGPEEAELAEAEEGESAPAEVEGANRRLRHLVDLTATASVGESLELGLNFDMVAESQLDESGEDVAALWLGVMVGARYAFGDSLLAAVRAEYLADPDGAATGSAGANLLSGTLVLEGRIGEHLIARLEHRLDWADRPLFGEGLAGLSPWQLLTVFGVVVTTG